MTAWEMALATNKRVFWEAATETIRLCPENYCIAARHHTPNGYKWVTDFDGALRGQWDAINRTIAEWQGGSTAEALANQIEKTVQFTVCGPNGGRV